MDNSGNCLAPCLLIDHPPVEAAESKAQISLLEYKTKVHGLVSHKDDVPPSWYHRCTIAHNIVKLRCNWPHPPQKFTSFCRTIMKGENVMCRDGRKLRFFYHEGCFTGNADPRSQEVILRWLLASVDLCLSLLSLYCRHNRLDSLWLYFFLWWQNSSFEMREDYHKKTAPAVSSLEGPKAVLDPDGRPMGREGERF